MDEELEEAVEDEDVSTDQEGEPEDPGDAGESAPVEEEPVPPVEDEGVRPDVDWDETIPDGEARVPQHFTSQPVPPYYIGDDWDNSGAMYVCIGDSTGDVFDAADWSPTDAQPVPHRTQTITRDVVEPITDYSAEKLAEYEQSGATAWAIYDDGSRVQVQWSEVSEPVLPDVAADEALEAALANGQHFWHNSDDAAVHGGAGVHVTDQTQEVWDAAVADGFSDLSDNKPYHNILINSLGMLLRTALNHLVSITRSAIAFFDGKGNAASNVVAQFGPDGATIGQTGKSHVEIDYHALKLIDKEGDTYFHTSDLRDSSGVAILEKTFWYDGESSPFTAQLVEVDPDKVSIVSATLIQKDEDEVEFYPGLDDVLTYNEHTGEIQITMSYFLPSSVRSFRIKYATRTAHAKAFTFGYRDGNVGDMSVSLGELNTASASRAVAIGYMAAAEGYESVAIGDNASALGENSVAIGCDAVADGQRAVCLGTDGNAAGYNSVSLTGGQSLGEQSYAEGASTASAYLSHAEGSSQADGDTSHAEGNSVASGTYSHAENGGEASGDYAHAENGGTASGRSSHAQGNGTIAAGENQAALGKWNVADAPSLYAVIVGNGTGPTARSNALTMTWSGTVQLAGGITTGLGGYGDVFVAGDLSVDNVKPTGDVEIRTMAIDRDSAAPSSNQQGRHVQFQDKDGERIGVVRADRLTDGRTRLNVCAYAEDGNGGEVVHPVSIYADPNGAHSLSAGSIESSGNISAQGFSGTGNLELKDSNIDRDGDLPSSRQNGRGVVLQDKDGERIGLLRADRGTDGRTSLNVGAFGEKSDGTEVATWLFLDSMSDGTTQIRSTSTLQLTKTTDASGTADKRPALIVGGTAAQAHLEFDSNEIMAKADGDSTATLWLNADGGTVNFGGNAQVSGHQFIAKSENIKSNTAVSATTNGNGSYGFFGSDNVSLGMINPRFLNTGEQGVQMYTTRKVGTADKYNTLALYLDASGNPSVSVTNKEAWREGIGLGDTEKVTAIASVITASEGVTISTAQYAVWGKMAQLRIQFKFDEANTADATRSVGVMAAGKRPVYVAYGVSTAASTALRYTTIATGGTLVVYGKFAANSTYTLGFTYLLP